MKRKLILALIAVIATHGLQAQQFYPLDQPVLPPSPSSSSVMKFSTVTPGISSGIIPVNIPLLTLPGRALSASVGLAYHASGVKVAETPGPVGSNWGLIGGGLITRTMYSRPDEMSEGYLKWKQLAGDSWSFLSDTIQNFAEGTWDSQPDVFHFMFPGHSGKFVFGLSSQGTDSIYTIPTSLLKIEWNDTDTIIEEFVITTEGGTKYYFGKSLTGNREAIEMASCDPFYTGGASYDYNSAWYLLQVISPTVIDTIDYHYSTCNEHIDYKYAEAHYYPVWTFPTDASVTSQEKVYEEKISYSVPILDSITGSAGQIYCYHSESRLDIPAGERIDSLALFNYLGDRIRSFQLDYSNFSCGTDSLNKRLILSGLTEVGSDGSELPEYSFTYNYGDSLPARDSDLQDYWGYYNKNDKSYLYSEYWDQDGASRVTDTARVQYGLLSKIDLPAGGSKEFDYESNYINKKRNYAISSDHSIYDLIEVEWDNVDARTPDTIKFYMPFSQQVYIEYELNGVVGNPHFLGGLYILSDSTDWAKLTNQISETGDDTHWFSDEECTIVLQSYDPDQSASIIVLYKRYRDFIPPFATSDAYVGGARIKKVTIHDDISSSNDIETTYTYVDTIGSTTSSGVLTDFLPNHHYNYRYDNGTSVSDYFVRYARTNALLFDGGYHIGYGAYLSTTGTDNGTTLIKTISPSDEINVSSEEFPYAYPISGSWKRGQVSQTLTYDSDDDKRSESAYTYAVYDEGGELNYSEITGLKASVMSNSVTCDTDEIKHISSWSHPVYQSSKTLSVSGSDSISTERWFSFSNEKHMKMTHQKVNTSVGEEVITHMKYPLDYATGSSNSKSAALTFMRETANLHGVPIETYTLKDNKVISASVNTFKVVNSILYPDTSFTYDLAEPMVLSSFDSTKIISGNFVMDDNYRALNSIDETDDYNRISEAHSIHGNHSVTLYGYNSLYPIATFSNASSDEVAYSSFECDENGGFTYNIASIATDTSAVTGEKILSSTTLSKSGLPSGKYYLTYWANSSPTITVTNGSSALLDNNSVNRQGMRFYQYSISANGSTTVSISSVPKIDEVRLFPYGAGVSTRTFTPLVGVTSQAGPNSIPLYTTYDVFGRPEKVKNQDKYIIQEYQYNYANQ